MSTDPLTEARALLGGHPRAEVVEAIASALTLARREGFNEGIERAAKACDAMANAGDPAMLAERIEALRLAASRIRALLKTEAP